METLENTKIQDNFSEKEAAKWLKISRATLQRARYRGEISYFRLGNNRIVYARRHLEEYCARREETVNNSSFAGNNGGGGENGARQPEAFSV